MKKHLGQIALRLCFVAFSGVVYAGEIPQGYRGVYSGAGFTLELKDGKAIFTNGNRAEKLSVERAASGKIYDKLAQGKSGLFIEEPAKGVNELTAYGVILRDGQLPTAGGLAWRRASVFYLTLNREQTNPVANLEITFCDDGLITLDSITRGWQIGWGPEARHISAQRINR